MVRAAALLKSVAQEDANDRVGHADSGIDRSLASILGMVSTAAFAGPTYNCKPDKKLDVAMQFVVDVQSAARVHVSAYGGSDRSNYVVPYYWRIYDSQGKRIEQFPRVPLVFVSLNMLSETNVEGLGPRESYTIELTSKDFCNNVGVAGKRSPCRRCLQT